MEATNYVKKLEKHFSVIGDPQVSEKASRYLLNQFPFFGLTSPVRKIASREFLSKEGLPEIDKSYEVVQLLWTKKHRELHYFAQELLEKRIKELGPDDLNLMTELVTHNSWWDTVDFIAPKLIGNIFRRYPQVINKHVPAWLKSGNIWLIRSALLFQLKYKKETDKELLFKIIRSCAEEKDFFIRKAIGWSLREYSKTDPEAVRAFVGGTKLSPLSRKEALKRIVV